MFPLRMLRKFCSPHIDMGGAGLGFTHHRDNDPLLFCEILFELEIEFSLI